jgi:hypothetical protein
MCKQRGKYFDIRMQPDLVRLGQVYYGNIPIVVYGYYRLEEAKIEHEIDNL